ncbi:hypothetical protein [Sphingomonas sp. PAMC 26605]|uniref:hypothetical protein n=1 Tax=Sphingomonas sp. PAMC 26605 TaxID=1112214 RepID=UPI00031EA820|nr:hypothetical protein [Sphingomonas sp. PAMC 26605]
MTFRLTPQMGAALRAGVSPIAPLIEAILPGHTLHHLVGSGEAMWGERKFTGRDPKFGVLLAAGDLKDGVGDEAPDWELTFGPPDEASAADLVSATAQGGIVNGWVGVIDRETGLILPDPIQVFAGTLDVPKLQVGKGTLSAVWRCVSALEAFHDQEVGARLSDAFHQMIWPGETGCANMSGIAKVSNWGVEKPPSGVSYASSAPAGYTNPMFQRLAA